MTASSAQLELAAAQTIEAATAALLWADQDSRGVLEHVAGASAARMAESRSAYAFIQAARREVAAEDQQAFDENLRNWMAVGSFEVADLPAPAVPAWTKSVTAAMAEAAGWINRSAADSAGQPRALKGSMRCIALAVCSYWGQDPLPLNVIDVGARIVSVHHASSARLVQF
jgi:hypothetical protein